MYGEKLMSLSSENNVFLFENKDRRLLKDVDSCGIILYTKNFEKILLVRQKDSNKWGFPKGSFLENEKNNKLFWECAKRELFEETKINLNFIKHSKVNTILIKNKIFFIVEILLDYLKVNILNNPEINGYNLLYKENLYSFTKKNSCNITLNSLFN
tara:strand:- start:65 stop:532 length:468 start_codon:yes stop_codon:yes gene_type:complete